MSSAADIEEIAARWLLRREGPDWSDSDAAELESWLEASTAHRVAFYRLEYGWSKADRLAALRAPAPAPDLRARRQRPVRARSRLGFAAAGLAAAAAAAGLFIQFGSSGGAVARFDTPVGRHETVPLKDGSRVELNTDTALRASVDRDARQVWLDRGEAYFEVAHDAAHPFVIHAGDSRITVLGTKFSVRRDGGRVRVAVVEGRVKVEETAGPRPSATIARRGDIVVSNSGSLLMAADPELVQDDLSWRADRLTFNGVELGQAAAEFNRYNQKKLVVVGPAATKIRIGGSFEPDKLDAFVRLLHDAYDLKVEDHGDEITITG